MPKKQEDGKEDPPKAGRVKRQAAAATDDAPGPSNEAPAAKRPRGRPPKAVSVEPRAPKPIANTRARKLPKADDAVQPENESTSTSKEVPSKAVRVIRKKRSRSHSPSSTIETSSEAPRHRSAKRRVSRNRSRYSSRSRHGGRARKGRSRESSASRSERSHGRRRRRKSRRHARSRSSSTATSMPSKRGKKRRHTHSRASSRHGGRHVKSRKSRSSLSSTRHGRRKSAGKATKALKGK